MRKEEKIPAIFIQRACEIIANTTTGLKGGQIASKCRAYAIDYNVHIPYGTSEDLALAPNKRTALEKNILCFNPQQQFRILKDLTECQELVQSEEVENLRTDLGIRYGHLSDQIEQETNKIISETKHWLDNFPAALAAYNSAIIKYHNGIFQRNLLDDLRVALEQLLKSILNNGKSLENQLPEVGRFVKSKGGSVELSNMLVKLLDYYSKYQNEHIKHNDNVVEIELDFIFEMTSIFMKHLVKLSRLP